jgi:hypothetical protein
LGRSAATHVAPEAEVVVGWIDVGEVHTAEKFLGEKFMILPTAST